MVPIGVVLTIFLSLIGLIGGLIAFIYKNHDAEDDRRLVALEAARIVTNGELRKIDNRLSVVETNVTWVRQRLEKGS